MIYGREYARAFWADCARCGKGVEVNVDESYHCGACDKTWCADCADKSFAEDEHEVCLDCTEREQCAPLIGAWEAYGLP